ncbi:GNAT family N-acetyltransferase [Actinoplanes sp. NPDC051411]|uniref:GNAT family N-acetyltransferase n=1 Tax=Actinoplanes sp. NPDC051411 TaxID=3155522 RepID=UPI0034132C73
MRSLMIRPGGPGDVGAVLTVFDDAVRWLVARGQPGQWGSTPFSEVPETVALAEEYAASAGFFVAEHAGRTVGVLVVGQSSEPVPAPSEPELFVKLLVTDHSDAARGVGSLLLEHARVLAVTGGVGLLRLDCYAGNGGGLVHYYERQGFTATQTFTVDKPDGPWHGQLLERRLPGRR